MNLDYMANSKLHLIKTRHYNNRDTMVVINLHQPSI
jgi:hypothetical protein